MTPLVTLDEANEHLRRDSSDDDNDVQLKILAASQAIIGYLRPYGSPYVTQLNSNGDIVRNSSGYPVVEYNSAGDPTVAPIVKAATLLLLGELYKSREGMAEGLNGVAAFGSLPQSVVMLLYPMRVPVMA